MKLRFALILACGVSVATSAIGQLQPVAQSPPLKSTCQPPAPGQTAWFDPRVYVPLPGNGVQLPRAISTPDPEYSVYAQQNRITGSLTLAVAISAGGTVDAVKVARSLEPSLDRNAADALRQWKFIPATKGGKTVPSQIEVEVGFDMR